MFRTPTRSPGSVRQGSGARHLRRATVALLAASLIGAPTGAATAGTTASPSAALTATPTATGTVSGAASPLSWAPPTLTAPTTVVVSATKRNLKLDATRDYIVRMPATPLRGLHGLQIHGGRNVVLVGGQVELPVEAITSSTHAGRGLYLKGQTGTVHVEGLHLTGPGLEDGINIDAPHAVVQLQNVRVDVAHGSQQGHHADVLQTWGGPRVLRVDGLTGYTQYQGLFLLPTQFGAPEPEGFDLRRIDLHGTSTSAYMIWRDALTWPLTVHEVYVTPRLPLNRDSFLWPKGTQVGTSAWPFVTVGSPAAGEFVPASDVGLGYTSPGYADPSALEDVAQVIEPLEPRPPVGALESVTPVNGGLRVTGWAADQDATSPLSVDVTAGGTTRSVVAGQTRADVVQWPGHPASTGFDTVVPLPVGVHEVCVTALNVGPGTDTALGCLSATVLDTTAPTFSGGPVVSLRAGTVPVTGVVPVTSTWSVSDDVGVGETRLTSPVTGTYSAGVLTADHEVGTGTSTWTVDAVDAAGNTATASSDVTVAVVPDTDAIRHDYWWTRNGSLSFLGGTALSTNRRGASLSHTFTGRSVGWVASRESAGGLADVFVDGVKEATVDLAGPRTALHRSVVFVRSWATPGAHTITVVALGGKDKQVTSDGFITVD